MILKKIVNEGKIVVEQDQPAEEEIKVDAAVEEVPEIAAEAAPEADFSEFTVVLNDLVKQTWDLINGTNGALSTLDYYYQDEAQQEAKENITKILNEVIDNCTINVGMIYKALELISSKVSDLIKTGSEQAEQITAEQPAEE